jgi:hypothetical protein
MHRFSAKITGGIVCSTSLPIHSETCCALLSEELCMT